LPALEKLGGVAKSGCHQSTPAPTLALNRERERERERENNNIDTKPELVNTINIISRPLDNGIGSWRLTISTGLIYNVNNIYIYIYIYRI